LLEKDHLNSCYKTTIDRAQWSDSVIGTCPKIVSCLSVMLIHSFIPDIYIAPLQETYSEALSVQLSVHHD